MGKRKREHAHTTTNHRSNRTINHPPATPLKVDIIDAQSVSSSEFYVRYIGQRKPCQISPASMQELNNLQSLWSNDRLIELAGSSMVRAELRSPGVDRFGLGNKVELTFEQFVRHIEKGNDDMYMTTQYIDDEAETNQSTTQTNDKQSVPSVNLSPESRYLLAPPLLSLITDFPLRPKLFDTLINHQVNIWFGQTRKLFPNQAPQLISSGLHHDYHDNLYVLLRGRKRIVLVEPKYAKLLKTNGVVKKIHKNGLICYDKDTYADGSDDHERATERKLMIEEHIQRIEEQLDDNNVAKDVANQLKSKLKHLESQLDDVLDMLMDTQEDDHDSFDGFVDDFVDSDDESTKKPNKSINQSKAKSDEDDSDPPNFSQLSSATLPASIPRIEVELEAPAMLYIPAS